MIAGYEEEFKRSLEPIVIDIQNHGRYSMNNYVHDNINDAYVEKDSRTYLCSDLLRNQMGGLDDMLDKSGNGHFAYFTQKDFSQTGAARTMALDVKTFFTDFILKGSFDMVHESSVNRYKNKLLQVQLHFPDLLRAVTRFSLS